MNLRRHYQVGCVALCLLAAVAAVPSAAAARSSSPAVVLGSSQHGSSSAYGWGTPHPSRFFNGGDPSGLVTHVYWTHWRYPRAYAKGKAYAAKPGGGYYARSVRIILRAGDLGRCDGALAYRRLHYRMAPKPGAPLQVHWHAWGGGLGNICRS